MRKTVQVQKKVQSGGQSNKKQASLNVDSHGEPQKSEKKHSKIVGSTRMTTQQIIDSKFDFAELYSQMSDIRKSFRDIERTNSFYKSKISQLHSHFYQKIVPGRTEERAEMEQILKQGGFMKKYKLVESQPRQKSQDQSKQPKFNSDSDDD